MIKYPRRFRHIFELMRANLRSDGEIDYFLGTWQVELYFMNDGSNVEFHNILKKIIELYII
jgi:hypothetical protein